MSYGSAPSPELQDYLNEQLQNLRSNNDPAIASRMVLRGDTDEVGLNDGAIFPPDYYRPGTPAATIRNAAAARTPLRGTIRAVVVLVDFEDQPMTATADHFRELFFSTGLLEHGSVREYYREVSHGLIDLDGEVLGPYRMPETIAWYANGDYGCGVGNPLGTKRARDMAVSAAAAADPDVDFGPYDNDGNGLVDAFIIVHAGRGGETRPSDPDTQIWSHKFALREPRRTDGITVYGYLTVGEDAKLGVCAHELGHLLFGFPDLYDADYSSAGVGSWCLMGAGEWNGGGDVPAHPSAWCKAGQGWVSVTNVTAAGDVTLPDVKDSHNVLRLWHDGASGPEYFLAEHRRRTGYDAKLPGDGMLIWRIDEDQPDNRDENHYKVALVQADAALDLELNRNRGDGGDPYPGTSANTSLTPTSTPSSASHLGQATGVSLTGIAEQGETIVATIAVAGPPQRVSQVPRPSAVSKPQKDGNDI
ncbi:M6 family metalloprotease domain-containing protein [Actinoplanes bogorensis]|uniref:M6 family metalloprotease domain-containing protein n=1 Tax=Paractinoplanes bogorensis TaxID=1610840 RepID=A0ABS5YP37_9ACTN|nr:M6 family metalloprotease domain-containing protein [Actinoplanes bogorensis]MBU2663765.1 M6 family metalloprotease domain-containing protein [Actinoplanes bogorensis]